MRSTQRARPNAFLRHIRLCRRPVEATARFSRDMLYACDLHTGWHTRQSAQEPLHVHRLVAHPAEGTVCGYGTIDVDCKWWSVGA